MRPPLRSVAMLARGAVSVMPCADRRGAGESQPFSLAPLLIALVLPIKAGMSNESDGRMAGRFPRGMRQFFHQISQMANSPWGNGPKGGQDGGKDDGGDRSGPRNPWVTPDPADPARGRKPRGPSALDELLRKGRGSFGGGGGSGGGDGLNFGDSAKVWKWGIGALVVTEGETIVGIFTERDYARKIALMGRTSSVTQVRDVMTTAVLFVRPDQTSEQCMQLMSNHRLRHLPVVESEKLVGMISIGDLVKDIISEQKFIIEQLEQYITGAR